MKLPTQPIVTVENHLMTMYLKCGALGDASKVFDEMSKRNLVSWNMMINGTMKSGHSITYQCLFGGLLREGIMPDRISSMSILGACTAHKDEIFRSQVHCLVIKTGFTSNYFVGSVLIDMHAQLGSLQNAWVRKDMRERGIRKSPSFSWIEATNNVHAFIAGDTKYLESEEIYKMLNALNEKIKGAEYVPDTNYILHDVKEKHKDDCLVYHSERIAIVFGLISLPPCSPIRIIKNLQVCVDYHNAIKFISKVEGRKVIIRDLNRFHHFEDGVCSCWDFW